MKEFNLIGGAEGQDDFKVCDSFIGFILCSQLPTQDEVIVKN